MARLNPYLVDEYHGGNHEAARAAQRQANADAGKSLGVLFAVIIGLPLIILAGVAMYHNYQQTQEINQTNQSVR